MKTRLTAFVVCISLVIGSQAAADTVSIDGASPSLVIAGLFPSDLVSPAVFFPGTAAVNTNAFTYGRLDTDYARIHFSVDRFAVGAAGTSVFSQSTLIGPTESASADVFLFDFTSTPFGTNVLDHDGDGSSGPPSAGPPGGLLEVFGIAGTSDDLDALDVFDFPTIVPFSPRGFWSVDAASLAAPGYGGTTTADVFDLAPFPGPYPVPGVYAPAADLGLTAADDIDALEVIDVGTPGFVDPGDIIYFSLAPGSPSLGGLGTAGDIFAVSPGGAPGVFMFHFDLGLLPTDNLNAFSFSNVPEPGTLALLAFGSLGLFFRRRRD